jgi:hypothetical protein
MASACDKRNFQLVRIDDGRRRKSDFTKRRSMFRIELILRDVVQRDDGRTMRVQTTPTSRSRLKRADGRDRRHPIFVI